MAYERGTAMLRFGHYVDFALQTATSIEIRERMADILLEYKQIFADKITHYIPHDGRRLHALSDIDYDSYIRERARMPDNVKNDDDFDPSLFGYPNRGDLDDPTIYYAEAIGQTEMLEFSRIGIYPPTSWPETVGYDRYRSLIPGWCEKIKPACGTAGLSILFNEGRQGLAGTVTLVCADESSAQTGDTHHQLVDIH